MSSEARRTASLEYILERGTVTIEALMESFGVSRMTVHRDLDELERQGFINKVRGGATAAPSGLFERDFRYRVGTAAAEKQAMAMAALDYVQHGQSVMLDDSTTIAALAERLADVHPLTVVTNGVAVLEHLADSEGISLIMLGGRFSRSYRAFLGLSCEQAIARLHASVLFCSASAISGTTVHHQEEQVVRVKRAMIKATDRRILMVDHHKFGRTALNHLADLTEFDRVITTDGIDPQDRARLEEAEVPVQVVSAAGR